MGLFGNVLGGVLNPVGVLANGGLAALSGGLDWLAAEKDRKAQAEAANAANSAQMAMNDKNIQMQVDFAKNGLRWRVDDAVAAGLSPLAALGYSGPGYSPVSTAFELGPSSSAAGNSYRALSAMGQNIARSINATRTNEEKMMANLELERAKLGNDLIRSQIAESQSRVAAQGVQPGLPVVKGHPESEAGMVPEYAWSSAGPGRLGIHPSNEVAMKNSSNFLEMLMWEIRKHVDPPVPPTAKLRHDYPYWNALAGEYRSDPTLTANPEDWAWKMGNLTREWLLRKIRRKQ